MATETRAAAFDDPEANASGNGHPPGDEDAERAKPGWRRVEYAVGAAMALLVAGLVIGFADWGGGDGVRDEGPSGDRALTADTSSDPLQAMLVDGEAADEAEDRAGSRSGSDDEDATATGSVDSDSPEAGASADPDATASATTTTNEAETPATTLTPSVSTTTGSPVTTSTTTGSTTTAATGQRLASPGLGRLVPAFNDSVADPNGQVQLSVAWEAVPGATRYENVYSVDGVELGRPGTEGTSQRPVAISWYQGVRGRQYCLQVVAYSDTQPASEPSVVCSVEATPLRLTVGPVGDQASTLDASWTVVEPAARYEVLTAWNAQPFGPATVVSQPRASIDIAGRTGNVCVILHALDAGGNRLQSVVKCADVP